MNIRDAIKGKAETLLEFFEEKDGGYHADHRLMYEVNVKMHGQYIDIDDVLETYPARYRAKLEEEIKPRVDDIYQQWLEDNGEQLLEMVKSGGSMQAMDRAAWQKYAGDALDRGEHTGYPAIDELKTAAEKRAKLDEFIAKDAEMLRAFGRIDATKRREYKPAGPQRWLHPEDPADREMIEKIVNVDGIHPEDAQKFKDALDGKVTGYGKKDASIFGSYRRMTSWTETSAGFYGRSAGHFCFDVDTSDIEERLGYLIDLCKPYKEQQYPGEHADRLGYKDDAERMKETIKEAEEIERDILYIKQHIEEQKKALKFEDELRYRIDEALEEIKAEEKEIKEKKKDPGIMQQTLAELIASDDETIARHATGILKASKKGK